MIQRNEYIKLHEEQRQSVGQSSVVVIVLALGMWGISCSPQFNFDLGVVEGGISNGYIVVFGPFILFGVVCWYYRQLSACLEFRNLIFDAIQRGELGKNSLTAIETSLLAPPHNPNGSATSLHWWREWVSPHLTLYTAIFCYGCLIEEYFRFHNSDKNALPSGQCYCSTGREPEVPLGL